jgi:YfiH family protein
LEPSPPHAAGRWSGVGPARRLTLDPLASVEGLAHAFTHRDSDTAAVLRAVMRTEEATLRLLRQVHGATVHLVGGGPAAGEPAPEGDALATDRSAVALGFRVADCVPILICDPRHRAIAAVHAGWRGTAAGVLPATVEALRRHFQSRSANLRLAFGPAIGPCCFEVGEEVVEALLRRDPDAAADVRTGERGPHVDLIEANRRQALARGIPPSHIGSADLCTACHPDLFWSYRRDGAGAGRMVALIGWAD